MEYRSQSSSGDDTDLIVVSNDVTVGALGLHGVLMTLADGVNRAIMRALEAREAITARDDQFTTLSAEIEVCQRRECVAPPELVAVRKDLEGLRAEVKQLQGTQRNLSEEVDRGKRRQGECCTHCQAVRREVGGISTDLEGVKKQCGDWSGEIHAARRFAEEAREELERRLRRDVESLSAEVETVKQQCGECSEEVQTTRKSGEDAQIQMGKRLGDHEEQLRTLGLRDMEVGDLLRGAEERDGELDHTCDRIQRRQEEQEERWTSWKSETQSALDDRHKALMGLEADLQVTKRREGELAEDLEALRRRVVECSESVEAVRRRSSPTDVDPMTVLKDVTQRITTLEEGSVRHLTTGRDLEAAVESLKQRQVEFDAQSKQEKLWAAVTAVEDSLQEHKGQCEIQSSTLSHQLTDSIVTQSASLDSHQAELAAMDARLASHGQWMETEATSIRQLVEGHAEAAEVRRVALQTDVDAAGGDTRRRLDRVEAEVAGVVGRWPAEVSHVREDVKTVMDTCRTTSQGLQEEVESLRARMSDEQDALGSLQAAVDTLTNTCSVRQQEATAAVECVQQDINRVESACTNSLTVLQGLVDSAAHEAEAMRRSIHSLSDGLENSVRREKVMETTMGRLETTTSESENAIARLDRGMAAYASESDVEHLRREVAAGIEGLTRRMGESEEVAAGLGGGLEDLRGQVDTVREGVKGQVDAFGEALGSKVTVLSAHHETSVERVAALEGRLGDVRQSLREEVSSDRGVVELKLEALTKRIDHVREEVENLGTATPARGDMAQLADRMRLLEARDPVDLRPLEEAVGVQSNAHAMLQDLVNQLYYDNANLYKILDMSPDDVGAILTRGDLALPLHGGYLGLGAAPPSTGDLVVHVPNTQNAGAGQVVFGAMYGNPIHVDFADPSATLRCTVRVPEGQFRLVPTHGVSMQSALCGPQQEFTGTVSGCNAALNGLTYTPPAMTQGCWPLVVQVDALGGADGTATHRARSTVNISVPGLGGLIVQCPVASATRLGTPLTFAGGKCITVNDDGTVGHVRTTLSVSEGVLTFPDEQGVTVTAGASGTGQIEVMGTTGDINRWLEGLMYTPPGHKATVARLVVDVSPAMRQQHQAPPARGSLDIHINDLGLVDGGAASGMRTTSSGAQYLAAKLEESLGGVPTNVKYLHCLPAFHFLPMCGTELQQLHDTTIKHTTKLDTLAERLAATEQRVAAVAVARNTVTVETIRERAEPHRVETSLVLEQVPVGHAPPPYHGYVGPASLTRM